MPEIVFSEIPDRTLVPGTPVEVDKSGAASQSFVLPKRILMIGARTSAGTVAAGVLTRITGDGQGDTYFGQGSHLAQMINVARSFSAKARRVEMYAIGVNDSGTGVAATGSIAVTGPASADGELVYLVGGQRVVVPVSNGDTATEIATAAAAVSHAHTAVSAAQSTTNINFTARNDGPGGNDISIVVLKRPAGVGTTVTAMASGANNPDLAATITAIAGQQWTSIALGFNDDGSADDIEAELVRRAGSDVDQRGHLFLGFRGSLADAITYGEARNSEYSTVAHLHLGPSTPWQIAAWVCMADAEVDDPARSRNKVSGSSKGFEGRGTRGITPTALENFLQREDWEMLLDAGVTPLRVDEFGRIDVVRMITTRQTDDNGAASDLQMDITVPRTLAAQIYTYKVFMDRLHPNSKKGRDGDEEKAANVATPRVIKTETMALFDGTWVPLGWVPASAREQFLAELIVEPDANDVNRFNVQFPTCIIPSLHVLATRMVLTIG
jgi:phage tail sheath gpL-like